MAGAHGGGRSSAKRWASSDRARPGSRPHRRGDEQHAPPFAGPRARRWVGSLAEHRLPDGRDAHEIMSRAFDQIGSRAAASQGPDPRRWTAPRAFTDFNHPIIGRAARIPASNRATYAQSSSCARAGSRARTSTRSGKAASSISFRPAVSCSRLAFPRPERALLSGSSTRTCRSCADWRLPRRRGAFGRLFLGRVPMNPTRRRSRTWCASS